MFLSEELNIIVQSELKYMVTYDWQLFDLDELKHACNVIDCNELPDRLIVNNKEIIDAIDWNKINKMKMIRLITRNIGILDIVDITKFNYSVNEIKYLLKIYPSLYEYFGIELEKLNQEDSITILKLGHNEFLSVLDNKLELNFLDTFDIIKAYNFSGIVLNKLDLKVLKSYQIAEIIIETHNKFLDILDLKKLSAFDWIGILNKHQDLIEHCDLKVFLKGDIFYVIELIALFGNDKFDYLLEEKNLDEISPLGWQLLINYNFDKYKPLCPIEKLSFEESLNPFLDELAEKPFEFGNFV